MAGGYTDLEPECRICLAYGERCHYDKPPPMSQVLAMAHKIEELERALTAAKEAPQQQPQQAVTYSTAQVKSGMSDQQHTNPSEQRGSPIVIRDHLHSGDYESPIYSSTSAIQEPTTNGEGSSTSHVTTPATSIPSMDENTLNFWTDAMLQSASSQLSLPIDKVKHLFKTHWTWVHPCFLFVSRPAFLRDAATGGEHFSLLLLCVLCLHSTRFTEHGLARDLQARVHLLLGQELHKEPSVPTIQALLQLSAKSIGAGEVSQAWAYSGLAFRMAVHMGIFSRPPVVRDVLSQGVKEQLAWSCYLWDKAISLYLGRAPSLSDAPNFEPPCLDEASEHAIWVPYFGDAGSGDHLAQRAHIMTCFYYLCKLTTIVNDILLTVYTKNSQADPLPFVKDARQKLEDWRASTPSHLLVSPEAAHCPPPHQLHANLMYYAATILLHRPFRSSKTCRSICREAADSIAHLFLLLEQSMGLSHVTYMMAYCAYTAATVGILEMADGVEGSQQRVNTYLRALYGARYSCPGIQRSIDIIVDGFNRKVNPGIASHVNGPQTTSSADAGYSMEPNVLPAFVSEQQEAFANYGWPGEDGGMSTVPFGGLDPFAMEWAQVPIDTFDDFLAASQQDTSTVY
ncbi:hypothetical protein M409DRAFT_29927 [Zasmidium cellare ATCC 36951]|uniref:Xylanolytic transcriptional activator regulatory domain-containing protein n=1 Tax=Zasmidium cellare ATCC 36951 TaxID=1080233 RepID=A0A6A6C028_ZASCE|nr:uncharacterized protein M409DRAFT_29927 [Zasmidium cellare ATCC 36951]KAF2159608.1 hypothetical protein M409DRAFT_29927 [Zasmidium cellare ATCC 36951]